MLTKWEELAMAETKVGSGISICVSNNANALIRNVALAYLNDCDVHGL
jgi:hypothetical protein